MASSLSVTPDTFPRLFLLLENPSKSNNLGSILRCASAFGITTIVTIGYSKCAVQGSHGASKNVEIIACPNASQAKAYLHEELQCTLIVGLMGAFPDGYDPTGYPVYENDTTGKAEFVVNGSTTGCKRRSIPLEKAPFTWQGNICIGLSKDRQGLPLSISRCCSTFVHVPHSGVCGDIPLLDTPSCLSIMLSIITASIGYSEQSFRGNKFDVARPSQKCTIGNKTERSHAPDESIFPIATYDGTCGALEESDNDGDY